jgi:hypothetical protein
LRRPLLWVSAALVAVATVPGLLWQTHHGWPQLAMAKVIANEMDYIGGRWTFLPLMLMTAGVGVGMAVFCYGLWRLLRCAELRSYCFLGYTFVGLVILFLATDGRFNYVSGFVALLLAVGSVEVERRELTRWWRTLSWPAYALSAIIALTTLPVLPVSWPTLAKPVSLASLGWPEEIDTVAGAYRALPPGTRHNTVVVADWYWDAAAIDRFGPARGLPRAYSAHRGYWYFGAPPDDADTALFVGSDPASLGRLFTEVHQVATVTTGPTMNLVSRPTPVWLCSGQRAPWSRMWPQLRHL